mgnify:CR=1 FL=1
MRLGWVCPKCHRVNSSDIKQCNCSETDYYYTANGLCDHVWGLTSLMPNSNGEYPYSYCKCGMAIRSKKYPEFNESF